MRGTCPYCGITFTHRRQSAKIYCGVVCQIMSHCTGTADSAACWVWTGAKRENGYGVMRVLIGDTYRMRSPPRVMYAAHFGEVPFTQSVLHACGTKNCCNPKHLRLKVQELHLHANTLT